MKKFLRNFSASIFCIALLLGSVSAHAQQSSKVRHSALVAHAAPQVMGGILLTDGVTNAVLANGLFMSQDAYVMTPKGKEMATWTGDASAYLDQLTSAVYTSTYDIYEIKTVVDATTGLVTLKLTYTPEK